MSNQSLPPGVLEALQRPSNAENRSTIRKLSDFEQGVLAVFASHDKDTGELTHKFDLLCPRNGCGSVILKAGVSRWVERDSVELDIAKEPLHPDLPALPAPPATAQWWLVTPNIMAFENIGFTKPVQQDAAAQKLKFLICAECDLGPLGWCEEGGDEFWLACSRITEQVTKPDKKCVATRWDLPVLNFGMDPNSPRGSNEMILGMENPDLS